MSYSISDQVAEDAVSRAERLVVAIFKGSAMLSASAGSTAGQGLHKGLSWGIHKVADSYNSHHYGDKTGEVDKQYLAKACQKLNSKSSHITVSNTDVDRMKALLQQSEVMFAVWDIPGDNGKLFQFLSVDRDRVLDAIDKMRGAAMDYGRVDPAVLTDDVPVGGKINTIPQLDDAELILFEHYAERNGLRYSVIPDPDGGNLVMFDPANSGAARRTLLDVGWTLGGADGNRIREQLVYRLQGIDKMRLSLREGQEEAYFCCKERPNHFVHVTPEGYSLHNGNDVVHTVSRDNLYFERQAVADIMGLDGAVYLTASQFQDLTRDADGLIADAELSQEMTMDMFPDGLDDTAVLSGLDAFAQDKRALDDEGNSPWGACDPSVSYSHYSGLEHMQDVDDAERKRYASAAQYAATHEGVAVERAQRSLADLIQDAQARSNDQFAASMGRGRGPKMERE